MDHMAHHGDTCLQIPVFTNSDSISNIAGAIKQNKSKVVLKELSHGILRYFGHMQNYLVMVGNLKITVKQDRKTPKT